MSSSDALTFVASATAANATAPQRAIALTQWVQTTGPAVDLSDASVSTPPVNSSFLTLSAGALRPNATYSFAFQATDAGGGAAAAAATVTTTPAPIGVPGGVAT